MRQGCPLSPLLYFLVANATSVLLSAEVEAGKIKGVDIKETEEQHSHGQFINNTSMIVEAKRQYVDQVLCTCRLMGQASSL